MKRPDGKYGLMMWQYIIAYLADGKSMSQICRTLDIGYHHKIFKEMERRGWVMLSKKGRDIFVTHTQKGHEMQYHCQMLYTECIKHEKP